MNIQQPFSSGAHAAEWKARNCENCAKQYRHDRQKYYCQWARELDTAWLTTRLISIECARAIGYKVGPGGFYTWDCPSLVKPGDPPDKGRGAIPGQYNLFNGGTNGE